MKVSKVPKGKDAAFARGGKRPMLGKGTRTRTAYPANPQRPGQTSGQASGKPMSKRTGAKVRSAAVDEAGSMGGSRAANPRRPAA
jgi:hypothetical protein